MMRPNTMARVVPRAILMLIVSVAISAAACRRNEPPVLRPGPPPPSTTGSNATRPADPPAPAGDARSVPPEPFVEDRIASGSLDDLNRNSPLRPVFFDYDSSDVPADGRAILDETANLLRRNPTWVVTIEGHCDERGTAEYNLALGERRAVAAQAYLVSLGIETGRLRTVSYGKEFPFDAGHDEAAWSKNRRAHFVITGR